MIACSRTKDQSQSIGRLHCLRARFNDPLRCRAVQLCTERLSNRDGAAVWVGARNCRSWTRSDGRTRFVTSADSLSRTRAACSALYGVQTRDTRVANLPKPRPGQSTKGGGAAARSLRHVEPVDRDAVTTQRSQGPQPLLKPVHVYSDDCEFCGVAHCQCVESSTAVVVVHPPSATQLALLARSPFVVSRLKGRSTL